MKNKLLPVLTIVAALAALAATVSYAVAHATDGTRHYGSMMNGSGYTMMGTNGQRAAWYLNGSGPVTTIAQARSQAQRFADRLGLKTAEVVQFSENFYVRLDDSKGRPATEVLVDPPSGAVILEYGPAMMWNSRYGMMSRAGATGYGGMMGGGMMGGPGAGMMGNSGSGMMGGGMMGRYGGTPSWTPANVSGPVSASQARALANRWLSTQGRRLTAGEPDSFPGYYTLETLENGKIAGMLSVNEQTGAVWYHWWHGRFVAMEE